MSDKIIVWFLKAWRGYSAEELAGFDVEVAKGLRSKGFAEIYEGEGEVTGKQRPARASAAKTNGTKSTGKTLTSDSPTGTTGTPPAKGGEGGEGGEGDDEGKP